MYCENRGRKTGTVLGMLKVAALVAAAILALLLTGCGDKKENSGSGRGRSVGGEEVLTFKTPEEQYRYVEGAQINRAGENFAKGYDNYMQALSLTDQKVEGELTLELFAPATEMLESYTGMDFSWLKTLGVAADVNLAEEGVAMEAALTLNGRDLIGADFVVDYDEGMLYGRVPRLSRSYFEAEFDAEQALADSPYARLRQQQELIFNLLPDGDTIAKILSRCADAALEQVEEVDEDTDTLTAGGVSAEYTALTVVLTEDLLQDMTEAVCGVLKEDKDVEDIIVNIETMTGASIYDEFIEQLDRLPDRMRLSDEIEMTVYVDDGNEIRGRVIEMGDYTVRYAIPEDDGDVGFELVLENDGEPVCRLSGEGRKSGDTIEGAYILEADETELATITVEDLDTSRLEDGKLTGKFMIRPTYDCYILAGASSLAARTMEQFSFAVDAGRNEVSFAVYMEDEPFAALTERVERGGAERLPSISGAMDVNSWGRDLMSGNGLQEYLNYLKNSDIPEELLQQLLGAAF